MTDDPISIAKYAFNSTTSPVTFPLVAMLKVKIVHEPPHDSHGISSRIKMPRVFGRPYDEVSQYTIVDLLQLSYVLFAADTVLI